MNQRQIQMQRVNQQAPPTQMAQMGQSNQGGNPPMMMTHPQWSHNMPPPPPNPISFPPPNNPQLYPSGVPLTGRNWKGKKPMDMKRKDGRRKDKLMSMNALGGSTGMAVAGPQMGSGGVGVGVGVGGYQPPTLYELEHQNRLKARRFYHPKKRFNRMGPYAHAPRNTTSYLIRAKKAGGIASLVSPCPVTPAVLPTPVFSPSRESLVDMAKEEWGVDGYGSMKGLIRLRSPGHDEAVDDYDDEDDDGSSESDVEEHVEVERRLDHDLSRFEMIYPNTGVDYHNVLENRVDDQDTHIAQLEEENLILKERLYLMERELGELRRRLLCLERQNQVVEDINEEVVENVSENDSEGLRNVLFVGGNSSKHNEEVDYVPRDEGGESEMKRDDGEDMLHKGLSELVVKDASDGNTLGDDSKDVVSCKDKQDVGLVNNDEDHVVDSMINIDEEKEEEDCNKNKKNVGESVKSDEDDDEEEEDGEKEAMSEIERVYPEAATDVSMEDVAVPVMNKDN